MKKRSDLKRVKEIIKILSKEIPDSRIALKFSNPLELLIATILSAQCTDVKVNQVTKDLFKKYRSAKDYAESNLKELEEDIRPTGFYRNKAKAIQKCCYESGGPIWRRGPENLGGTGHPPWCGKEDSQCHLRKCLWNTWDCRRHPCPSSESKDRLDEK